VISPEQRERLLARSPYNAVRVELPVAPGSDGSPERPGRRDDDYGTAAATLWVWRDQGVLRVDERPALYVYEEAFRLAGDAERVQRGFFARLRLEPLGAGVRPHERTMSGPKEDRLRLLRATATNISPIVVLPGVRDGRLGTVLARVADRAPDAEATDDSGVRHRLWVSDGDDVETAQLIAAAGQEPLTIADGHHRYETALRYRDEQGSGSDGATPGRAAAADHVLVLVLDPGTSSAGGPLILPTHRVVHGGPSIGAGLVAAARATGVLSPASRDEIVRAFSPPFPAPAGRVGLVEPAGAHWLEPRPPGEALDADPQPPPVARRLDVSIVEAMLAEMPAPVTYVHDAADAAGSVAAGEAAAAILLAPTPLDAILAVAAAGAVMPQKSTYFYPKVATGLVMNPLE